MHGIAMIVAMVATMWKRSDNNDDNDGDSRAKW